MGQKIQNSKSEIRKEKGGMKPFFQRFAAVESGC
jgi:hypothetical protein